MAAKKKRKTAAKPKARAKAKPAAKRKAAAAPVRPVKDSFTKSQLVTYIAEQNEITRKQANEILASIEGAMLGSVHPRGAGEFTFPGLFKVSLRKIPARKAGTLVRNPATGEMVKGKAKPASVRVKIRPLSKLKAAATK